MTYQGSFSHRHFILLVSNTYTSTCPRASPSILVSCWNWWAELSAIFFKLNKMYDLLGEKNNHLWKRPWHVWDIARLEWKIKWWMNKWVEYPQCHGGKRWSWLQNGEWVFFWKPLKMWSGLLNVTGVNVYGLVDTLYS